MSTKTICARISWNRLDKTIHYRSINEPIKVDLTFKQKGEKFVLKDTFVLSNGHTSKELQHKLNKVALLINKKYSQKLK